VYKARACAISGKGSKRIVRRVDVQNFAMPQLKYRNKEAIVIVRPPKQGCTRSLDGNMV